MDQTHPANIECNNINNSNDDNNNKNVSNSNINNKVDAVKKDVLILQSSVTKRKPEDIEATWRGPEGEAGSRVWVVKGQAGVGRGRFLVARRTLPAGSLILDESPLVVAPKTSVTLTCVNCCSRIGIPYLPCAGCGFPLCATCQPSTTSTSEPEPPSSLACQSSPPSLSPASRSAWRTPTRSSSVPASSPPLAPASSPFRALPASSDSTAPPSHRSLPDWHKAECDLLKANGWKLISTDPNAAKRSFHMLAVLRLLLHGGWQQLESHAKERLKRSAGIKIERTLVPVLGRLSDNGGNVLFNEAGQVSKLGRLIFPRASLLNSSCLPSCVRSINSEGCLLVTTARPILAGEELTICYADPLLPTNVRQEIFKHKHFTCECERCEESFGLLSPCVSYGMHKSRCKLESERKKVYEIRNL